MRGYVYVLSNRAIPNLVKIGYTTRSIEQRIQELSSTGVPGKFVAEFYCLVDNAPYVEKGIHNKLSRDHFDKEFFKCSSKEAVKTIKEFILHNSLSLHASGGRSSQAYITEQELTEIKRRETQRIETERIEAIRHAAQENEIRVLVQNFLDTAPVVNFIIERYKIGTFRELSSFALALTGIGLIAFDFLSPTLLKQGVKIGEKISDTEKKIVRDFKNTIERLRNLSALDYAFDEYYKKHEMKSCHLVGTRTYDVNRYYRYSTSGWLDGLISCV